MNQDAMDYLRRRLPGAESEAIRPLTAQETTDELAFLEEQIAGLGQLSITSGMIAADYGQQYARLLEQNPRSVDDAIRLQSAGRTIAWTCGDRFYRAPAEVVTRATITFLHEILRVFSADHYCELGCGFGANLDGLKDAHGGELTEAGIQLGLRLGQNIVAFDFRHRASYELLRAGTTVFTVHAIEQLPSAAPFVEHLKAFRARVRWIVHLEPTVLSRRSGALGAWRNEYTRRKCYNTDLADILFRDPEIELVEFRQDLVGSNPLNPHSLFVWRFRAEATIVLNGRRAVTIAQNLRQSGYAILPGILAQTEVADYRRRLIALLEEPPDHPWDQPPERRLDVVNRSEVCRELAFHPELIAALQEILGQRFYYLAEHALHLGSYRHGLHRDSDQYAHFTGDRQFCWQNDYGIIRVTYYLQSNGATCGGGLDVVPFSHLGPDAGGEAVPVLSCAGDVVLFDFRCLHQGTAARETPPQSKLAMFLTAGPDNDVTRQYIRYFRQQGDAQYSGFNPYAARPETLDACECHGVKWGY